MDDQNGNKSLQELLSVERERLLLVKFEASWCVPCKAMQRILEKIADKYYDWLDAYSIDVDDDPDSAVSQRVRSVPTMILYNERGAEMKRWVGMTSRSDLEQVIDAHVEVRK